MKVKDSSLQPSWSPGFSAVIHQLNHPSLTQLVASSKHLSPGRHRTENTIRATESNSADLLPGSDSTRVEGAGKGATAASILKGRARKVPGQVSH